MAIKKQLLIAQRLFLRSVVSAYSTTSTQALLVLAGIVPLHIEAGKRAAAYADKQAKNAEQRIRDRWNFEELNGFKLMATIEPRWQIRVDLFTDYSSTKNAVAWVKRQGAELTSGHAPRALTAGDTVAGEIEAIYTGLIAINTQNANVHVLVRQQTSDRGN